MTRLAAAFAILVALVAAPAAAAQRDVAFAIRPVLESGRLRALAVEARWHGDADGMTEIHFPESAPLPGFRLSGGTVARSDGHRVAVTHAPGAALVVTYDVRSGFDDLPAHQPMKPLLRPDWFAVYGDQGLVRIEDREDAAVSVTWRALPAGWIARAQLGAPPTMRRLWDAYLVGGAGWREVRRPVGKAQVTLLYRPGGWTQPPEAAFDTLSAAVKAGFDYWGDRPRDFFVPILQLGGGDFGGRGMVDGFLIYAGPSVDLGAQLRVFTHEHQHSWISRQIGGFPETEENLEAWLNEGFAEAMTARALLKAGLWREADFAADLNESLARYWTSPVREAPNARIQADRSRDFDVGKLPYDRGRLLALHWERRIRDRTPSVGLHDVLQAQRRLARANDARGHRASADSLLPAAMRRVAGLDIADDLVRYVERGEAVTLPSDLFSACGRIEWVTQPVFDRGFDLMASLRNDRRVIGLDPDGPAARAGLKTGDRIRISEIPSHNSQTPLTYRVVEADGGERSITYKPEGKGEVRLQRLVLRSLDAVGAERCRRQLIGEGVR